jgi:hypothetical protein
MSTNSFYPVHREWKIQLAEEQHVSEIAQWIKAIDKNRTSDANLIAGVLRNGLQLAKNSSDIAYYVGTRNDQLLFYFNGALKERRGVSSGKILKKLDCTLSVVLNVLVPNYQALYIEVWFNILSFLFRQPSVGRIITEVDLTDDLLFDTLVRLGFRELETTDIQPNLSPCYACNRTDFAPLAAL